MVIPYDVILYGWNMNIKIMLILQKNIMIR